MEKIVLCGNANVGKSTCFNKFTKGKARVGNWLGVTCNVEEKIAVLGGDDVIFADLPGLSSLTPQTDDENAALNYLEKNKKAKFLNVCDINNLRRNLFLTLELIEQGLNLQIMLNFKKSFKGEFNIFLFKKMLDLNCVYFGERLLQFKKSSLQIPKSAEEKHKLIEKILSACYKRNTTVPYGYSTADKVLLNKFFALPIFALISVAMFAVTFVLFPLVFSVPIDFTLSILKDISSNGFYSKIIYGTLETVLVFLPQIMGMLFCLNVLENSGYISRLAFLCDDFFAKIGLSGKSVFPMLLSFGCASVAVDFVKTIKNKNAQIKTAASLSILPCSAKIPIMLAVFSLFFGRYAFFAVCALFFACIVLALVFALILNKSAFKTSEDENLVLEFPTFKTVQLSTVLKNAGSSAGDFLKRVFGVVIVLQTILFLLGMLEINFGFISVLFAPIGFNVQVVAVALVFGIVAKELILTTLFTAGAGVLGIFSPPAMLAFLVFALTYTPCASTVAGINGHFGTKVTVQILIRQFIFAYVLAGITFFALGGKNFWFFVVVFIVAALRLAFHKKACKKCVKCDRISICSKL